MIYPSRIRTHHTVLSNKFWCKWCKKNVWHCSLRVECKDEMCFRRTLCWSCTEHRAATLVSSTTIQSAASAPSSGSWSLNFIVFKEYEHQLCLYCCSTLAQFGSGSCPISQYGSGSSEDFNADLDLNSSEYTVEARIRESAKFI